MSLSFYDFKKRTAANTPLDQFPQAPGSHDPDIPVNLLTGTPPPPYNPSILPGGGTPTQDLAVDQVGGLDPNAANVPFNKVILDTMAGTAADQIVGGNSPPGMNLSPEEIMRQQAILGQPIQANDQGIPVLSPQQQMQLQQLATQGAPLDSQATYMTPPADPAAAQAGMQFAQQPNIDLNQGVLGNLDFLQFAPEQQDLMGVSDFSQALLGPAYQQLLGQLDQAGIRDQALPLFEEALTSLRNQQGGDPLAESGFSDLRSLIGTTATNRLDQNVSQYGAGQNILNQITGAAQGLEGAANPYDTRMQALIEGPLNQIDQDFDEAEQNLINRFAVEGKLDLPEYRFELERLQRDRALAKGNIRSQFAQRAAGTDITLTNQRLGALNQALEGALGLGGFQEAGQNARFGQLLQALNPAFQEAAFGQERGRQSALDLLGASGQRAGLEQAAEGQQRGRIQDLLGAGYSENQRVLGDIGLQLGQEQINNQNFISLLPFLFQGIQQPQQFQDQGLQLLLSGLQGGISPGQALQGALSGMQGAGQIAGNQQNTLFSMLGF